MRTKLAFKIQFIFFLLCLIISSSSPFPQQKAQQKLDVFAKPAPGLIEESLIGLINEEREKQGLSSLRESPALTGLARKHSQDMATQNRLSHLSSSQESYLDRLVREGFFFGRMGENVARSETFVSRWIHQSLMDSPEHRENILNPGFDEVGIGVVDQGQAVYFVTQDFIQSLEIKTIEEARKIIVSKIQDVRRAGMLPPILISENMNQLAQLFARARVEGQTPPPFPEGLGETLVLYMTTPFLDDPLQSQTCLSQPKYEEGGVGVEFSRAPSHPGGAYFLALMFFPAFPLPSLPPESQMDIVINTLNKIRLESGLERLGLEERLSRKAQEIGSALRARQSPPLLFTDHLLRNMTLCYYTQGLELIPENLKAKILASGLKHAGLDIAFVKTAEFSRGVYLVSIILE
jgi:uncharacterized protein YkwD